MTQALTVYSV